MWLLNKIPRKIRPIFSSELSKSIGFRSSNPSIWKMLIIFVELTKHKFVDQVYRFLALIGGLLCESLTWRESCGPWNRKRIQIIISFWEIYRLGRVLSFSEYKYLVKIHWLCIKKWEFRIDESCLLYGFGDASDWLSDDSE
jgi:hypothetical protein